MVAVFIFLMAIIGVPLGYCVYVRLDYVRGVRDHEKAKARQEEYLCRMRHPV